MPCYITQTGAYLPGTAVANHEINRFLGSLDGESEVMQQVLSMNGIVMRHYAQNVDQLATESVYQLARRAVESCLEADQAQLPITFLAAGSTYAPLAGPGFASLLHHETAHLPQLNRPLEISSHGGFCTSSAAALVAACRAVESGTHERALCVGAEHCSEVLKSTAIRPVNDRGEHQDLRNSRWFMSVFLRFMLSDGAGAFLMEYEPKRSGVSLQVDWAFSQSMAHETPICMQLDNATRLLSQDVRVLQRFLFPLAEKFVRAALDRHRESLTNYRVVLPHMSSFFFRRKMERMMQRLTTDNRVSVPYWTNLATAGNTGAASIYVMLNQYLHEHTLSPGDRLLLFIPESGQFNFVLVSLTAIVN